ncbi:MAG: hypothetical protein E6J72_18825, partial [Deltaproteobacteria bacterium]
MLGWNSTYVFSLRFFVVRRYAIAWRLKATGTQSPRTSPASTSRALQERRSGREGFLGRGDSRRCESESTTMNRMLDITTSMFASVSRLGAGVAATPPTRRPVQLLEVYEFESCPFCRKVRDALTELDLEAMIYPCPKGGTVFRPKAIEFGGKAQFPYLVDPNTGTRIYESDAIVDYLFATYGGR